jgi:hypothetical protein
MFTPSPSCNRVRRKIFAMAGIFLAMTAPVPTFAQNSFAALESLGPPVDDQALSNIRGKFIRPESVSYFGISMITSWQDQHGVTTVARLVFNVNFLATDNGEIPGQMTIGWVREGDPAMDVSDSHTGYTPYFVVQQLLPVGALGDTRGAAQANVIAGADNAALNTMQIALVPASAVPQFAGNGMTPVTETTSLGFADGDALEFRLGTNEIGLALSGSNGADSTIQSVGGDFGRMLQQTVLNSDGNSVLNSTSIIIGTDQVATGFDAVRTTEAMSVMRGHGF